MKLRALLLLAAAATLHVSAQTVMDYSKVPECARQCTILDQAEKNCVPPAAPVTDQATYQSCFCLSALLTPLHSSGSLCEQFCGADNAAKISQYYTSLCNGPVVQPPNPMTTTVTTATTSTGTSTATAGAAGAKPVSSKSNGQTWWDKHWKYVIMVIVIAIAMAVIWIGGIYLRRHFDRKADAKRANMAATDAPFDGSSRSVVGGLGPKSNANLQVDVPPLPPVRAIVQERLRSRSSSLTSAMVSSKSNTPHPVVLGPHQHMANATNGQLNSHPSSGQAIAPPPMPVRNHDAMRSDPKFVQYRATPTSITVEDVSYNSSTSTLPRPSRFLEHSPDSSTDSIHQHAFDDAGQHTLNTPRSIPSLQHERRFGHKLHKANKY
ncbi:uncharacterized protein EI97DRAFT_428892 [Westerdykella ornata]|uniref:CFEM domain-containing protein n=1 Tax=Westerdykella ornata TaxID=318751 RepID=A0A6A6JY70_WESOR|nr:uncharacterized protein EI97DRAFT_428892 [Westerdykella ornata]KAF2280788.1 hypothetical protein EI97DRAFT_428892 [Westerdykella ornata]